MRNKIIFSLLGILIFSVSSCKKDYLETAPTDQVDNSAVFTTTSNANTSLNGIYRYMFQRYGNQNQPGVGGMFLAYDFMGDDIGQTTTTWFTAEGSWNSHRADNDAFTSYAYRLFYRIIGNANFIIDNVDGTLGSDAEKRKIKAEALTLRAYGYSYLVQMFGKRYDVTTKPNIQLGVPLLVSSTDANLPRSTVEEVYTQINKDLDDAIALNISARVNKSHINVLVAKGLRARVALTMQDYPNAIKFAKEVIDSGLFPLMTAAAYQIGFNDSPSLGEFMWASIPAADQADTFGSFYSQIAYNANTTYMRGNPKRINSATYNKISDTDVRKKMWEPTPNATNFPLPTTGFQRVAFMSRKFSVKVVGQPTLGDVPLMRSSEMFLILAEAYAKTTGGEVNARTTLFSLVSRRDPNAVISTNIGQALVDEILLNRRVELWGEGFRWLDLKRLNLALDRSPAAFPNFIPLTMQGTVSIPAGDVKWQFLIPRAEIEANLSLSGQQNP
jgi:hypothetical protein